MRFMLIIIYIIFICLPAWAGTVQYCFLDGKCETVVYDDKHSLKDYTQRNLLDATDLEGKVIYASSFSQETPDTKVFPDSVKKMTFYNCNLSNVLLPPNSVVIGGQRTRYKAQTDGEDWIVDANSKPKEPVEKERFIEEKKSINPVDIKAREEQ